MQNETRRIKIALLTASIPQNRRSWSGSTYFIGQALQKHCGEVTYIGPLPSYQAKLGERLLGRSSKLFLKKYYLPGAGISAAKWYGKVASQKLAGQDFDIIVVAEGAEATTIIPFLETDIPVVYVHDVTFALLHNYNQYFSNLLGLSVHDLDTVEALAINRASLLVYSTTWAARSAVQDYRADPRKVHVIHFGANLEKFPSKQVVEERKRSRHCRLLFVGVDWQMKGGDIAFETLVRLEEMGVPAELVICGCIPPSQFVHDRMTIIPFLDKSDTLQLQQLEQLYASSDFLLLPTRNECFGIVFCEGNAFGLPAITTRTGGVSEVVRDGENGFTLPYEARGADYAEVISKIYRDEQQYAELVKSSRQAFDDRLNWNSWGIALKKKLTEMLEPGPSGNAGKTILGEMIEAN